MTTEKLQIALQSGESEQLEFKTSFGQDAIETLVAFANAKGGRVLLGVSDSGTIVGINLSKESVNQWINEIKSKTAPQLVPNAETLEIGDKTVAVLSIAEYPVKPVSYRGRYYKRIANTNHQMSIQEVVNIHLQSVNSSWDFYARPNKDITQISLEKVNRQIEKINKRKQTNIDDPLTFLRKYSLIDGEKITNACWLMFLPEQESTTTIELGHFASSTVIKDSLTLKSDLFTEVDEVMDFIRKHINKEIIITGDPQNTERWEYPLEAIRELVLNMIVHRDYTSSYDSIIKIFPDHIKFYNPGALPDNISIKQLMTDDYISRPRNKQIAEIFKETGIIEKYGSGVTRIRREFIEYGLPAPIFENVTDGLIITVYGTRYADASGQVAENVTDVAENVTDVTKNVTDVTKNVTDATKNVTDVTKNVTNVTENVTKNVANVTNVAKNVAENVTNVTENAADVTENVIDRIYKIMELISENNQISTSNLAGRLAVTKRTILRDIEKLKIEGLLERVGPDKGGYWKIKR
ncbi:MAG: putative DNA binding domain-containing protein [Bacteroidales bacterium]|jgi:ATP-dependent DNA helicase RecG|nr:putative DNA binding domain-containing protein [Bacteroidales bacterium]